MSAEYVPVTQGSADSRALEVDGLQVVEAWFPPGLRIPPHRHDRPIFAVMVEGSFDLDLAHRTHECMTSAVFTEPLGERHANRVNRGGARVVVLQPDPGRAEMLFAGRIALTDRAGFGSALASVFWSLKNATTNAAIRPPALGENRWMRSLIARA